MKDVKPKVKLLWLGELPIRVRVTKAGEKLPFTKGSWQFADFDKAQELAKHYKKFRVLSADEKVESVMEEEAPAEGVEDEKPKRKLKK